MPFPWALGTNDRKEVNKMRTTVPKESAFEAEHLDLMTECDELRSSSDRIPEMVEVLIEVVSSLIGLREELMSAAIDLDGTACMLAADRVTHNVGCEIGDRSR